MKISNLDAIKSLDPNAELKCNNDDIDSIKWLNGTKENSKDAILAEVKRLQAEYNAQAYARTRKSLYPDIGDQLDDLYKKGAFSDEMAAKIKKVKDDNPKS